MDKCRENPSHRLLSRLATVPRFAAFLLLLALGAGVALTLASCGGEDAKLLPGGTAAEITENLDRVQQYAEEGECIGAENSVAEVNNQIESLSEVDPKLVEALRHGAERLEEVIASCEEDEAEAVTPSGEAPSAEEEEKIPPGQEKKAEKEREKEEAALEREKEKAEKHPQQPPPPTPAEPPTESVPPPPEGGGTGAPGGVSPGEPVEGEQGGD